LIPHIVLGQIVRPKEREVGCGDVENFPVFRGIKLMEFSKLPHSG